MEESKSSGSFLGEKIEGLVTLETACELVPFPTMGALYQALNKHKAFLSTPLYRMTRRGAHGLSEIRMLPESDILKLRELTMRDHAHSRYARAAYGRPKGSRNATIRSIMNSFYADR